MTKTSLYAEDGEFEGTFVSRMDFKPGLPVADLQRALAAIEQICRPADHRTLSKAVAEMAMLTKARAEDGADTATRIALMARHLEQFPGDVAVYACKRWADGYKFFPSWMELRMQCQMLGGRRLALREGLRRALVEAST